MMMKLVSSIAFVVLLSFFTATSSFMLAGSAASYGSSSTLHSSYRTHRAILHGAGNAGSATTSSMIFHQNVWRKGVRSGLKVRGALKSKRKWGQGMWDKFTNPPESRAHDEVTFRSGCTGRTLTIPQGV